MRQEYHPKEYVNNLKLSFPVATNTNLRPGFRRTADAVTESSRSYSSGGPALKPALSPAQSMPTPPSPEPLLHPLSLEDGKEQAILVAKSLISFVSGVSAANRSDILESTLLAQMGARAKVPDESDTIEWYNAYVEILSKTGWTIEGGEVQNFSAKTGVLEVQSIIIDILTAAFGADLVHIVSKALESIKTLADSTGKIEAFEKNTHTESSGCFQVGIATQEGGAVSINLGTFLITSINKIRNILFIKFTQEETNLQYASGKLTLDQNVYENIRSLVRHKLSGRVTEFVSEIPI